MRVRIMEMTNPKDYASDSHLQFLENCTPSQKLHSIVPIAFKQNENGVLEAVKYMVITETTQTELDKLTQMENEK